VASPSRPNYEKVKMKVSIIFGEYCGENEPNLQRPLTYPKLQEACAKVLEEGSATEEIPTRGWG